ncbi:MAG: hypothetical protein ACREPG_02080, partial [Candidatus Binatia bacterium]
VMVEESIMTLSASKGRMISVSMVVSFQRLYKKQRDERAAAWRSLSAFVSAYFSRRLISLRLSLMPRA